MASMFGCAYQVTNTAVEMLFVLDHRLRDHAKRRRSLKKACDDIFDSLVQKFVDSKVAEEMFTPRRLFSFTELSDILREIMQNSSLRLSDESYAKLYNIALMSVKLQVMRCNRMTDVSLVTEAKLRELRDMTGTPALRDELTRVKGGISVFYGSLSAGELARVRTTLLNEYRLHRHAVGVLIEDGFQASNGSFVIPTDGANMAALGSATVYGDDGTVLDEYVLPIAGKTVEAVPAYFGDNLFSRKRVLKRARARSGRIPEDDSDSSAAASGDLDALDLQSQSHSCTNSYAHWQAPPSPPGGGESDGESACSSASYATRLQATRAAAAVGSPRPRGGRAGTSRGGASPQTRQQARTEFPFAV